LKDLGYGEKQNIYINESLTQLNGDLYQYARSKLLKTNRFRFVWITNGIINVKEDETNNTKTLTIKNREQINKLFYDTQPKNFSKNE